MTTAVFLTGIVQMHPDVLLLSDRQFAAIYFSGSTVSAARKPMAALN